jgi:hypothetical protein
MTIKEILSETELEEIGCPSCRFYLANECTNEQGMGIYYEELSEKLKACNEKKCWSFMVCENGRSIELSTPFVVYPKLEYFPELIKTPEAS